MMGAGVWGLRLRVQGLGLRDVEDLRCKICDTLKLKP